MRQNKYLKIFTTWSKHNFKLKFKFSEVIMEGNILKTFWKIFFEKWDCASKLL